MTTPFLARLARRAVAPRQPGGRRLRLLAAGSCAAFALSSAGCVIPALIGGMARSYEMTGESKHYAEYTGLQDKSYVVLIRADRFIEAEYPGVVAHITQRINDRLANHAGAASFMPSGTLVQWMYNNPTWITDSPVAIAEQIGVQRVIIVELMEYRLTEPGNRFVWDGSAAASVAVYETDTGYGDLPAFEKVIQVGFPDMPGQTPQNYPKRVVNSALSKRVVDRVSWLFYDHMEPNSIEY